MMIMLSTAKNMVGCITWEAVKSIADEMLGWHLPTDDEWKFLELFCALSQGLDLTLLSLCFSLTLGAHGF